MNKAFIAKHIDGNLYLCRQAGAGTLYYLINSATSIDPVVMVEKGLKPVTKEFVLND